MDSMNSGRNSAKPWLNSDDGRRSCAMALHSGRPLMDTIPRKRQTGARRAPESIFFSSKSKSIYHYI